MLNAAAEHCPSACATASLPGPVPRTIRCCKCTCHQHCWAQAEACSRPGADLAGGDTKAVFALRCSGGSGGVGAACARLPRAGGSLGGQQRRLAYQPLAGVPFGNPPREEGVFQQLTSTWPLAVWCQAPAGGAHARHMHRLPSQALPAGCSTAVAGTSWCWQCLKAPRQQQSAGWLSAHAAASQAKHCRMHPASLHPNQRARQNSHQSRAHHSLAEAIPLDEGFEVRVLQSGQQLRPGSAVAGLQLALGS